MPSVRQHADVLSGDATWWLVSEFFGVCAGEQKIAFERRNFNQQTHKELQCTATLARVL